ncbi:TBC1 domain family member 22B isoform X4 [Spea bombifrons]|uniref:TBC1 domain family member 22B isoform X4 n=1 Tax=Spea bombifrons TaxID=233779 RepID=UPI0023496863|nr:TBC1 domain family member 22B isoform X4 [Spea bombifrons]
MSENSRQLWKRSANLPGRVPPFHLKNRKASSFHEFARNTSDAWNIEDDEVLHSSSSQTVKSSIAVEVIGSFKEKSCSQAIVINSISEGQPHRGNSSFYKPPQKQQQQFPLRPIIPLVARISDQNASGAPPMTVREKTRLEKFRQLLSCSNTDLEELRKCSWPGIPREVRPTTWRLLSGYLPAHKERRKLTLQRKREEYFGFIEQYYDSRNEEHHKDTYRQIHIDIPRTNPLIPLFQQSLVQEIFERILFIWAIRHPASGYVQGINDLVTPFFVVFLTEHVDQVHCHFQKYEVEYLQFAFRWMNNLLMRELPLRCTIRLWDTYQAEPEGFSHFHLYVCAAFLIKWRKEIMDEDDFQGLLTLLQNLPTIHWGNEEIGLLLAEAYRLKYMFADAPNHYRR